MISGTDVNATVMILSQEMVTVTSPLQDTNAGVTSAEIGSVAIAALDLDGDGKTDLAVGSLGGRR